MERTANKFFVKNLKNLELNLLLVKKLHLLHQETNY